MNELVYAADILAIRHRYAPAQQRTQRMRGSTSPSRCAPFALVFWIAVAVRRSVIRPILVVLGRPLD